MFAKPLYILSFLFLFFSCKNTQEDISETQTQQDKNQKITELEASKLKYVDYILDSKTEEVVQDWIEYLQLQSIINDIKKGNLVFFEDDQKASKLLLKEFKNNIPESLNSESIHSRILALETKLLKLESLSNLNTTSKEELLATIKELFVSFSNLNFQMNKKIEFDNRAIEKP